MARMKSPLVFIHGMFLTSRSWEKWIGYFQKLGYTCHAPAWPFHTGEPSELRASIPEHLGELKLSDLESYLESYLRALDQPVVIGHSLGGLLAQRLAARGLARAAVCLCPVAPNRMMSIDWGFLKNTASITNPLAGSAPYEMTPDLFRENFANRMRVPAGEQAFEEYAVHESRQVLRDVMGPDGEVKVDEPHVPLLFIGAEEDAIIPASLVRRNAHAYTDERSHSEYISFTGRGHFICGEDGWEEVALVIANWLVGHVTAVRS